MPFKQGGPEVEAALAEHMKIMQKDEIFMLCLNGLDVVFRDAMVHAAKVGMTANSSLACSYLNLLAGECLRKTSKAIAAVFATPSVVPNEQLDALIRQTSEELERQLYEDVSETRRIVDEKMKKGRH